MQIGQPCLVTILLNPSLLDSAFFCFSCASSKKYILSTFKNLIPMLIDQFTLTLVPWINYKLHNVRNKIPGQCWVLFYRYLVGNLLLGCCHAFILVYSWHCSLFLGSCNAFQSFQSFQCCFFAGGCWGLRCYDCEGAHCTDPANLQVSHPFVNKVASLDIQNYNGLNW